MDSCLGDCVTTVAGVLTASAGHHASISPGSVARLMHQRLRPPASEHIPVLKLWDLLFEACRHLGAELLVREAAGGRRWLTRAELLELGPRTLVGLPALALLRTALRGACVDRRRCPEHAVLLCSGQLLTAASAPQDRAIQQAVHWLLEAQDALRCAQVLHRDLPVLDGLTLWEGDLKGVAALVPGEDVESTEDLTASSLVVPAGSSGEVQEVSGDRQEALVQWAHGKSLVQASKLLKMGGDRPKPLEAQAPAEADARTAKMQVAVGRARAAAVALSAMPTFTKYFYSMVVLPLVHGTEPAPPEPEIEHSISGHLIWRIKSDQSSPSC